MKTPPEHWKNLSLKSIPGERWIDCVFTDTDARSYNFKGFYQVSTMGRVRTVKRFREIRSGCIIPVNAKVYKADNLNGTNYLRVRLTNGNVSKAFLVHRLVMLCFTEKIPGKPKVNHKRGIKWDNRLKMLEWSDHPENIQHAFDTGLHGRYPGEKSGMAKITNKTAISIFNASGTQHQIAKKFKVSRGVVCAIKRGASWGEITGKRFERQRLPLSEQDIVDIKTSPILATELAKKYKKSVKLIRKIRNGLYFNHQA